MVVAVGILDHLQTATIALVHLEGLLVFGILFGDDAPWVYKILERHGKSAEQAPGTRDAAHEVALEILSCRNLILHTNHKSLYTPLLLSIELGSPATGTSIRNP